MIYIVNIGDTYTFVVLHYKCKDNIEITHHNKEYKPTVLE